MTTIRQIDTPATRTVMTPCVGICSTSIAGSVCRGCKRYAHEVIRWNSYSPEERQVIWKRLESFRLTILANWIEVVDETLLKYQLEHQKIKFNPALPPLALAYDLLRAGASQVQDPAGYGLRRRPHCTALAMPVIFERIEKEYLELSEAHYSRYFGDVRQT